MSRTLKRPMFRRGGQVNDGIMTGLTDRKEYSIGGIDKEKLGKESQIISDVLSEFAPIPKTQLPLGQFGLNLASGKFAGSGALQNLIGSAKDPYAQFVKTDDARERDIRTGSAKLALGQAMKEAQPSNKYSQISLKAKEAFGNPNIKNPTTGKPFTSYGEAFTFFSMSAADPASRSIEGRVENTKKNYLNQYGNSTSAKTHAIADEIISPLLSQAGKNYTGKKIGKKNKQYRKNQPPGVYVDIEKKLMVEVMPNGDIIDLPEYSKYFAQFQ